MPGTVRLEIDFLEIMRKRNRWNLYFLIATEDPTDPSKTVVTSVPQSPILVRKLDDKRVDFEAKGTGETNGMIVMERELPEDNSIRVRLWVVQSRDHTRNAGSILSEVSGKLGGDAGPATDLVTKALGAASPWISITKGILGMSGVIGNMLKASKDKKLGFVSLDESFVEDEFHLGELDRTNTISAFGELGWTYVISN